MQAGALVCVSRVSSDVLRVGDDDDDDGMVPDVYSQHEYQVRCVGECSVTRRVCVQNDDTLSRYEAAVTNFERFDVDHSGDIDRHEFIALHAQLLAQV
jgi:hypothetical protein